MFTRVSCLTILVVVLPVLTATAVRAEITAITGSTQAQVQQFRPGAADETDQASDAYPDPTATLPLQIVARLVAEGEDGAASVAVQFADPEELTQPNPEEFAVNLALLSAAADVRYDATATAQENRSIVFTTADFPLRESGETVPLVGQLFVDGALAVFSPSSSIDLTDATVTLRITIVKQVAGHADETVFTGSVGLQGGADGAVTRSAGGSFPTLTLIQSDLSIFIDDFALFEVLIIPRLTIRYDYDATIDEAFTLQATVVVEAANAAGEVGVAAVIGAPVDAIQEVITAVRGDTSATKTIDALQKEREDPTGEPAFPQTARPLLPFCGWLGFESLLGFAALAGYRYSRPYARRRTRP